MRNGRSLDDPDDLQRGLRRAGIVEQAGAGTQEHGCEVDLQLVDQPGLEVLLHDAGATAHEDVLVFGGRPSLFERGSIPSVTNVKVVPPSMVTVSRA
jgi:hypothetical protein